jgi:membrane protease YdiL (CAAX protease family)
MHAHVPSLIVESARAHAMRFERPLAPAYGNEVGSRILWGFIAVAAGVFYALRWALGAQGIRGLPGANLAFVVALLFAFLLAQRLWIRAPLAEIGLRPFGAWTRRERLYLFQVVPLAIVAFSIVFHDHLRALLERHGPAGFVFFSLLTGFLWGIAQELLYRGWLQTELTRRFGARVGLLAANVIFTFGPLHFDALFGSDGVRWGRLAAVFGIGLFFGILFRRSGNLWLPAVLHGLWPPNMA